jgi:hypothetical protein
MSKNITNNNSTDQDDFRGLYRSLPDPGPAYISGRVMDRIHKHESLSVRPRHVALGMASSFVGVLLGFWLATATVSDVPTTVGTVVGYVESINGMEDGLDQMIYDLTFETLE